MWLIARRSFAEGWMRLGATMLAALFSVGLIAGTLQFSLRAQEAVSGSDASEYSRADVLVHGGEVDPDDIYAVPDGRVRLDQVAGRPGVAAVAGDASVPMTVASAGKTVMPPAGGRTLLRPWVPEGRLSPYKLDSGRAPARDGEVAVVRHMAGAGTDLSLSLPRETQRVKVVGVVTVQGRGAVASGDLVLAPPEAVQRITGLPAGTWQSVWVKAAPGVSAGALKAQLAKDLKGTASVRTARSLQNAQSADVQSAGTSLGAVIGLISSVAVFVGLFVVANTFGTLVRQRTRRLALLSAIGATPRQIKRLIRFEALALGLVASAGGVLLGYPVSSLLTRLFARDGFDISAADAQFGWVALTIPAAIGILVTQLAAWRAARRAARVSPMQALRTSSAETPGRRWPRLLGALAVFASAWMFYGPAIALRAVEPPGPETTVGIAMMIFMGSMVTVAGLAVLAPLIVAPLGAVVGRIGMAFGGEAGRLARATIVRSPRRVSAAAASLMLGLALATSTALLVLSAEGRFAEAGAQVMRAEHAVASTAKTTGEAPSLPRDAADRIKAVPGVTRSVALTQTQITVVSPKPKRTSEDGTDGPRYLAVTGADQAALPGVLKLGGRLPALRDGEIAITSAMMEAHGVKRGQRIVVRGARGRVPLTVAAAYHDPSHLFADQALAAPATMERLDPSATTQVILVSGGASDGLAKAVAGVPGAKVMDRPSYVETASAAMTSGTGVVYGFLGMALVLSLFGMATTVSMSVSERTREFGLLGAVGTTAAQIRSIIRWEAATVVLIGTLLGVGAAFGSMVLLHEVTGSSFVRLVPPWWLLPLVVAGAAAVTLLTSALPARRASGIPVLEAAKAE